MEIINWNVETLRPNFAPDGTQSGMLTGTIDVIINKGEKPISKFGKITGIGSAEFKVNDVLEQRPAKGNYTINNRPVWQRLMVVYVC